MLTKFLTSFFEILFPMSEPERMFLEKYHHNLLPQPRASLYPWLFSCFSYKSPTVKKAVHIIKKRQSKEVGDIFAEKIIALCENNSLPYMDMIFTHIPLSHKRMRERGFNQADFIISRLRAQHPEITSAHLLEKVHDTDKQALIQNPKQRAENVRGSFRVTADLSHYCKTQPICIIDDVTTTGATVYETYCTLTKAGCERVYAITLAH